MAYVRVLRSYNFIDKDPVIDEVRTVVQDEGLIKKLRVVADLATISFNTIDNWFNGDTKRPQHAKIMAVMRALGYERKWEKTRDLDYDKEIKLAREWLKKEKLKADMQKVSKPKKRKRKTKK